MKLDDYFTKQLRIFSNIHSKQTLRTKKSYYYNHISPIFGKKDLEDINGDDLQEFVNDLLVKKSSRGTNLAPKTVENIIDIISVLYTKAIKSNIVKYNPVSSVELPKYDNAIYFSMPEYKMKDFIDTVLDFDEPLYRGIFIFLLHGRRLNEVLSITWSDIDFQNKTYTVPWHINKTRKTMSYSMTDKLYDALIFHRESSYDPLEFSDLVFISPVSHKKISDIRKPWKRLLKKAGIEYMRIHDIRHLIGYYAINYLNIPIEHVSFTLGHTNILTTQKYVNVRSEISKDVISSVIDGF